jgi:molybdopterin molybdotransferase
MPEFLELMPPTDALKLLISHLPARPVQRERVQTSRALGRVTAATVVSPEALPAFSRSTVDGYAVFARDTFGASDTLPMYLALAGEVPMGRPPEFRLLPAQAALIHTGGMLPEGADAVVMLETVQAARPDEVEILKAVASGENTLKAGEDVKRGDEVLPAGTLLRPAEIGGLMALGILDLEVVSRPTVGIISSGDEVVAPESAPFPGQVRDVNSYTLSALVSQHGACPRLFGIVADQAQALRATLREALSTCDMVVITAGSSASSRDLTATIIQEMGAPGVLVHGVNVKPGKPTILAICNGKPVIGLPGNPVSALVIAGIFLVPLLEWQLGLLGRRPRPQVPARLAINLASQAGREDWVPVRLVLTPTGYAAEPIFFKSNLIFSLTRADGLIHIPPDANGLAVGEIVLVELF